MMTKTCQGKTPTGSEEQMGVLKIALAVRGKRSASIGKRASRRVHSILCESVRGIMRCASSEATVMNDNSQSEYVAERPPVDGHEAHPDPSLLLAGLPASLSEKLSDADKAALALTEDEVWLLTTDEERHAMMRDRVRAHGKLLIWFGSYAKVPIVEAAKLLNDRRSGPHALRLLAIRQSHGDDPDFTLNEIACTANWGVSSYSFAEGINGLVAAGRIERTPHGGRRGKSGHRFASDKLLSKSRGYIAVPISIVKGSPFALALYVAIYTQGVKAPRAFTVDEIYPKLGIKTRKTADVYVAELEAVGHIAVRKREGFHTLIAQKGYIFAPPGLGDDGGVRNFRVRNFQVRKFRPIHTNRKGNIQQEEKNQSENLITQSIVEPFASASGVHDPSAEKELDWKTLSDWTTSRAMNRFLESPATEWFNPNGIDYRPLMTLDEWGAALERFTDDDVPAYLKSSHALRQATEIALTLRLGDDDDEIIDLESLLGVAWHIGKALNAGRRINSLGFIAVPLASFVHVGDFSWARDFPMDLTENETQVAQRWVEFSIGQFKRLETGHCPDRLRASRRAQDWIYLVNTYGRDAVQRAIATPTERYYTAAIQLEATIKRQIAEPVT